MSTTVDLAQDLLCPMTDGTSLAADVYGPDDGRAHPVLLMRTPYGKSKAQSAVYRHPIWYARRGYVVVVQDVRGTGSSGGEFVPFVSESQDGADTITWCAGLEGSDGSVVMYGYSYAGFTQLAARAARPEGLVAIAPAMTAPDPGRDWIYPGGAFSFAFSRAWALQLAELAADRAEDLAGFRQASLLASRPPDLSRSLSEVATEIVAAGASYFADWVDHPGDDRYWRRLAPAMHGDGLAPMLLITGWFDQFIAGASRMLVELAEREVTRDKAVIGPWCHHPWSRYTGTEDFGPTAETIIDDLQLEWFTSVFAATSEQGPGVRYFRMGENVWADADSWPPRHTVEARLHLDSGGAANTSAGDGSLRVSPAVEESEDVLVFDPSDPVRSLRGTGGAWGSATVWGPMDHRTIEQRGDVLVYTTAPLRESVTASGPLEAVLTVSSDRPAADIVARLTVVDESERSVSLAEGHIRFESKEEEVLEREVIKIDLGATSIRLAPGERLRLQITSSNFPAIAPNAGTVGSQAEHTSLTRKVATHRVHHGPGCSSYLRCRLEDGRFS